ncbi:RUN and SH3 domain-containing protein 1 isoform X1 [Crotalus tigris]|uniref:RUN and SH3 domain-containing protein 1 isoform X1 n=1 Tax=Crotalus tigris TaxID=88082 RepID=UPI00192F801E|nr:RUN and SH3 domain-containing protein 1 isoform X1 [Crotalus tigris]
MQSPKQSLVCNLNHVHLQHVSLGLQLSKRPELQEDANTLAPSREHAVCHECEEHGGHLVPNLVDANSNNPSLTCRCCEAHPVSSEVKRGLRTPSSLTNCPTVNHEEEEEEVEEGEEEDEEEASPSDPTSSSISSCSDLSLDESPVSVYCKPFPAEQARSPESQPNIVPLEDTQNVLVHPQERGPNLNAPLGEHPEAHIWDSPDSLYSSSSPDSPSDHSPPCPESLVRSSHVGSTKVPPLVPPPVRPCRAPPAVPVVPPRGPEVDSNCNALPAREVKPNPISLGQVDINSNRATGPVGSRFGGVPPPIPPRTKRALQGLKRSEGGKPSPELVRPAPVESSLHHPSEPQGETPKKTITSFHELAQKRKKATVAPPLLQTKKDQSDWLIVFSPETEMPPSHQLSWATRQETAKPPTSSGEPSPPSLQRGVITFKDLRYRKQNSQLATKVGNPGPQRESPAQGVPDGHSGQEWNDSEAAAHGHLWGAKEIPARMKRSRLALQPIVERGCEEGEDAAVKPNPLGRPLETEAQARWGPDACRKAETGDTRVPTAHQVPSRPRGLLVPLPPARGKAAGPASPLPHPHRLEQVAELPSDPSAGAFCPRLKTLSCEDVCLLATAQGPIFEAVSPDLPIRLSPIGAYSPPARSLLPFLNSPDLAVLFSPFFPSSKSFPILAFPTHQVSELSLGARDPLGKQGGKGPWGRVSQDTMRAEESGAPRQLRHSQSFAGVSLQRCPARTGDAVSTQLRQQKKALLVAVSASVDKIVAHFSTARNLVQKAQLGDSQLTPEVGHLILHTLCPALHALVGDGLKPFQKDVITGYRPSSPWSVVEASARPGAHTRTFTALYWRVSRLAPLRSHHQCFHAFILGLLNLKQVEEWFTQLQRNSELVSSLYLPTAFLLLSQRICPRWAEELLLLLQPLSVLTFQLDLLFEHRHLPISVRPMPQPSTPSPEPGAGRWESPGLTPLDLSEPPIPFATLEDAFLAPSSPFQEWLLPQRLLGWKERLASTLRGNGSPAWAQPGQEESPAQPPSRWTKLWVAIKESRTAAGESGASAEECPKLGKNDSQVEKRSSVCKEDAPAARSPSQPGMDPPEAGEVYLEGTEEKPEAGNGNERRLDWLFGANSPGAVNETDPNLLRSSRRPSRWLCSAINTLAFAKKGGPTQKTWQKAEGAQNPPDPVQTYTAVRALCDHAGEAAGHLAFCKGEILQVMETVDENWLKCLSGGRQGLVHVGYTSLII